MLVKKANDTTLKLVELSNVKIIKMPLHKEVDNNIELLNIKRHIVREQKKANKMLMPPITPFNTGYIKESKLDLL